MGVGVLGGARAVRRRGRALRMVFRRHAPRYLRAVCRLPRPSCVLHMRKRPPCTRGIFTHGRLKQAALAHRRRLRLPHGGPVNHIAGDKRGVRRISGHARHSLPLGMVRPLCRLLHSVERAARRDNIPRHAQVCKGSFGRLQGISRLRRHVFDTLRFARHPCGLFNNQRQHRAQR